MRLYVVIGIYHGVYNHIYITPNQEEAGDHAKAIAKDFEGDENDLISLQYDL